MAQNELQVTIKHYEWHKIYHETKKPFDKATQDVMEEWDRVTEPYRKENVNKC